MDFESLKKWFLESPVASWLRHLVVLLAGYAVADFVKVGHLDFSNWETWVVMALAALIGPASKSFSK